MKYRHLSKGNYLHCHNFQASVNPNFTAVFPFLLLVFSTKTYKVDGEAPFPPKENMFFNQKKNL